MPLRTPQKPETYRLFLLEPKVPKLLNKAGVSILMLYEKYDKLPQSPKCPKKPNDYRYLQTPKSVQYPTLS
jgi:hypothetical protein